MAIINKEAHHPTNVSKGIKEEFFQKLRDLCCLYGVHIGTSLNESDDEYYEEVFDGDKLIEYRENNTKSIPVLYFEFFDGSEYEWSDGELEYDNYNTFINVNDSKDYIGINGVSYAEKKTI